MLAEVYTDSAVGDCVPVMRFNFKESQLKYSMAVHKCFGLPSGRHHSECPGAVVGMF